MGRDEFLEVIAMRMPSLPTVTRWLCVSLLAGLVSGCTAGVGIHVQTVPDEPVYVAWSDVHADAEGLVVEGVVRRSDLIGPPIPVTVSVEILSSSGDIVKTVQSDRIDVPCRRANRAQGFQRFMVRLPNLPADGTSLRVSPRSS
jgi:hypothetical protein